MRVTDILAQMGGLQSIAQELGVDARSEAAAPSLSSMIDKNGDGNPLDDILRLVGKVLR